MPREAHHVLAAKGWGRTRLQIVPWAVMPLVAER